MLLSYLYLMYTVYYCKLLKGLHCNYYFKYSVFITFSHTFNKNNSRPIYINITFVNVINVNRFIQIYLHYIFNTNLCILTDNILCV